jgi:hypothetical protein
VRGDALQVCGRGPPLGLQPQAGTAPLIMNAQNNISAL